MSKKLWNEAEKQIIKEKYGCSSQEELMGYLPGRTWSAIKVQAASLNVKSDHCRLGSADLTWLLEDTYLTYYWMGFLMADGHFSKEGTIYVALSKTDKKHLEKLAKLCNVKNLYCKKDTHKGGGDLFVMSAGHKIVVDKLKEKFSISSRKTYEPCNISIENDDLFLAWLIGFIDGDGCIYKTKRMSYPAIQIAIHESWINNLQYISDRLKQITTIDVPRSYLTERPGMCHLSITNSRIVYFLKQKVIELNLPILDRKWSKIDLNKEITLNGRHQYFKLWEEGKTPKEISIELGVAIGTVYVMLSRYGKTRKTDNV